MTNFTANTETITRETKVYPGVTQYLSTVEVTSPEGRTLTVMVIESSNGSAPFASVRNERGNSLRSHAADYTDAALAALGLDA